MSVVLLILKIIGITLLVIIGLILLILIIVLFVPFRYRLHAVKETPETPPEFIPVSYGSIGDLEEAIASGDFETNPPSFEVKKTDGLAVRASVTWLLHLVSFVLTFEEGKMGKVLKIAGIRMKEKSPEEKEAAKKAKKEKKAKEKEEKRVEEETKKAADAKEREEVLRAEKASERRRRPLRDYNRKKSFAERFWETGDRVFRKLKKIRKKISALAAKVKKVTSSLDNLLTFLGDERTGEALGLIFRELGAFLKDLLPKHVRGFVRYGDGDPAKTGQITAIASALYPFYGKELAFYPEFRGSVIEGDVDIRGRLRLWPLAASGIRIIVNKNVKYVLHFLKTKEA